MFHVAASHKISSCAEIEYRVLQKELFGFESLLNFIQRAGTVFELG
jgi:hypothetical protein